MHKAITPYAEHRFSVGISNASILLPRRTVHLQALTAVLPLKCWEISLFFYYVTIAKQQEYVSIPTYCFWLVRSISAGWPPIFTELIQRFAILFSCRFSVLFSLWLHNTTFFRNNLGKKVAKRKRCVFHAPNSVCFSSLSFIRLINLSGDKTFTFAPKEIMRISISVSSSRSYFSRTR